MGLTDLSRFDSEAKGCALAAFERTSDAAAWSYTLGAASPSHARASAMVLAFSGTFSRKLCL